MLNMIREDKLWLIILIFFYGFILGSILAYKKNDKDIVFFVI